MSSNLAADSHPRNARISEGHRSDALYQGPTLVGPQRFANIWALQVEGYGLQAVHNCCVMNPALAAEGCYSSRNHPLSAACLGPEVRSFAETTRKSIPQGMKAS